jgi:hypothetical protein
MSKAFDIFRKLNIDEEGVGMLMSFIIDPECWEFWRPKIDVFFDLDEFGKVNSDEDEKADKKDV